MRPPPQTKQNKTKQTAQVAYFLGTHGPSVSLETACGSSIVALAMAAASLQAGDCDTAIVLGLNFFDQKDFHLSLVRFCSPRNAYRDPMTEFRP